MMKQNKMQNERINQRKLVNPTKKEWRWHMAQFGVGCLLLFFAVNVPVLAAGNVDTSHTQMELTPFIRDRGHCTGDWFHLSVMGTV